MDLQEIEDRIAIGELKARYCLALDTKDWAGYAACFTEDLELDTRPSGGTVTHGRDATVALVRQSIETATTCHQVHSPIITFNDDGSAEVVWAMQDRVIWGAERQLPGGLTGMTGYGHYHDHVVKGTDRQWRIARQTLTRLHIDKDFGGVV
jgi:hypothetical protein